MKLCICCIVIYNVCSWCCVVYVIVVYVDVCVRFVDSKWRIVCVFGIVMCMYKWRVCINGVVDVLCKC